MKMIYTLSLGIVLAATLAINPTLSYAVSDHQNFLFGAASSISSATGQKNANFSVTIVTPQSFSNTLEDHNWHLQMHDASGYDHNVGYFVRQDATSTPKFFDEEISGGVLKHSFEGMSSVGANGAVKSFAIAEGGGAWNYDLGTTFQNQGNVGEGSSFDAAKMWAIAEKICPTSPYCTSQVGGGGGPMPSVKITNAMQYSTSLTFPPASWTSVSSANAYYEDLNSTGSGDIDNSKAQSELCLPLSMKGHHQDATLSNNQLVTGNGVVTTCVTVATAVWP